MNCPKCGHPAKQAEEAGGGMRFFCPTCGWGLDPTGEASVDEGPWKPSGLDWAKLGLLWVLSAAVVVGPFFALWFGVPYMLDVGVSQLDQAVDRFHAALLRHYWWVMLVYLVLAAAVTPQYDRSNLGLFGSPLIDNPFSLTDDYNRGMRNLFFLLAPGKLVFVTLQLTYRTLRAAVGG